MRQKSVMIVEDEGLIANNIAAALEKNGYGVFGIAASGEEAIAALQGPLPDLVLMDIRLKGGLDGVETALRIHSEYKLPIIFLTSYADPETRGRAKEAEPFGFLVKPFRALSLCSAVDIALHKHQTERALLERDAWLTTILDSTADATVVADTAGSVRFLNKAAESLLGYDAGAALGRPWSEAVPLFDSESGDPSDDFVALCCLGLSMVKLPFGLVLRNRDGAEVPVEGEVAPSVLGGEIAGAVLTFRDVSRRVKEEEEVRREQKMLLARRLAAGVAEEFNQLLSVIVETARHWRKTTNHPADLDRLRTLLDAASSAGAMSAQLVTLSRSQAPASEVIQVDESVRSAIRLWTPSLKQEIRIETELDPAAGKVRMNAGEFGQVLLSLLIGASDSVPEGGTVRISTSRLEDAPESFVRVTVSESGGGTSSLNPSAAAHSAAHEDVFEPFFPTTSGNKTAGLRLALVYGIVKDAGGRISVQRTPGSGAQMELLLPAIAEGPLQNTRSSPKTILLVEDEAAIRKLIHNYFENRGFNVIEAENGAQGLRLAELHEDPIDLLICDVVMPGIDGFTLARELSASRPFMKCLLISGQYEGGLRAISDSGELPFFMQKPFALQSLLKKVEEITS